MALLSTAVGYVPTNPLSILLLALLLVVIYFGVVYSRLRHIPGPFWASITNFARRGWVLTHRAHDIHIALHRKYGSMVRFGPNMVSISDPAEIPTIYGIKGTYHKSSFYEIIAPNGAGKGPPGLFGTQDEELHRTLKRPIASIYSMSNLVSFEPYVDSTMGYFLEQLDRQFVGTGAVCDFNVWLQLFAFDVVGEITFSKRLGFLEKGGDVDGIMTNIWAHFCRAAPAAQMPWVELLRTRNPVLSWLKPTKPSKSPIFAFAMARMEERRQATDQEKLNSRDFLSRFIEAKEKAPSAPPWSLLVWTTSNITAGSDTTAILLRTVFYNLLKHPSTMDRLVAELHEAKRSSRLSEHVTWKESIELPYLDAVIKEAGRIHPPFGLPLERVVPVGGAEICGKRLEAGTVVGMSPWVVHHNRETFGEDCDEWRPERWIDCSPEQKAGMERSLLTFGAGHRSCLGKNISYLEIYKLVPTILQRYELEFAVPGAPNWHVDNQWFVPQTGLDVRMKARKSFEELET